MSREADLNLPVFFAGRASRAAADRVGANAGWLGSLMLPHF
jgi:hypothetical protein